MRWDALGVVLCPVSPRVPGTGWRHSPPSRTGWGSWWTPGRKDGWCSAWRSPRCLTDRPPHRQVAGGGNPEDRDRKSEWTEEDTSGRCDVQIPWRGGESEMQREREQQSTKKQTALTAWLEFSLPAAQHQAECLNSEQGRREKHFSFLFV